MTRAVGLALAMLVLLAVPAGRRVFIGVAGDAVATNLTAALFDDGD